MSATPSSTPRPLAVLALESSTEHCSVALLRGEDVVERGVTASAGHSENILPLVQSLLTEAGMALTDLDAIAYGAGPGAFTGLRLACGVAQGLAFGGDLPVVGVGSLEALAWSCGRPKVYACLDARMNEVYFAAYEVDGPELRCVLEPGVEAAALAGVPEGGDWFGCGSGFATYGAELASRLEGRLAGTNADLRPTASAVARLGAHRLARGEGGDAFLAQPAYVRQKVALTTAERLARGGKA